jgi:hypothetical protein
VLVSSFVTLTPVIGADRAFAQTAFSVSANIGNFHVAVANYYQVPEREVIVIRERSDPRRRDPGRAVHRAARGVPWGRVVDMRLRGDSWWNISVRLGVQPDVYYVPVTVVSGPPYGRALGHYKNKHRKQWSTIVLSDADMVNLVELQFLSEHYHVAPERIIEMRGRDRDFVAINAEFVARWRWRRQGPRRRGRKLARQGQGSKGHGKGRGRD